MKAHDKEELGLMKSIETEAWISVDNLEEEIKKAKKALVIGSTESEWFQLIMGRIPKSLESADLEIVGQKKSVCSFSTTSKNICWETI
jgi:hypothetical protein